MERFLGAYSSYLYALMRIVVGLLFACHGAQKLLGLLGGIDQRAQAAPRLGRIATSIQEGHETRSLPSNPIGSDVQMLCGLLKAA